MGLNHIRPGFPVIRVRIIDLGGSKKFKCAIFLFESATNDIDPVAYQLGDRAGTLGWHIGAV